MKRRQTIKQIRFETGSHTDHSYLGHTLIKTLKKYWQTKNAKIQRIFLSPLHYSTIKSS